MQLYISMLRLWPRYDIFLMMVQSLDFWITLLKCIRNYVIGIMQDRVNSLCNVYFDHMSMWAWHCILKHALCFIDRMVLEVLPTPSPPVPIPQGAPHQGAGPQLAGSCPSSGGPMGSSVGGGQNDGVKKRTKRRAADARIRKFHGA